MQGYTKLFSSIVTSTIWREPNEVRIVWITMLALSDQCGEVQASIPGLADMSRVTIEQCEDALTILLSPDKYSRSSENEGRRIEKIDGGWIILNHAKYRKLMSADERKEYFRVKKAEQRAREKGVNNSQDMSLTVFDSLGKSTKSTHTEADTDTEAKDNSVKVIEVSAEPEKKKSPQVVSNKAIEEYNLRRKICSWKKRKSTYGWSKFEESKFREFASEITPDQINILDWWFSQENHFERFKAGPKKSVSSFLGAWMAEVEKATNAKEMESPSAEVSHDDIPTNGKEESAFGFMSTKLQGEA